MCVPSSIFRGGYFMVRSISAHIVGFAAGNIFVDETKSAGATALKGIKWIR
jgi:hypothetical protein